MSNNIIISDPKVWGPGVWMTLHIIGYTSNNLYKAKNFISIITDIISNLPCDKCRKHALGFVREHDFTPYMSMRGPNNLFTGPFKYICDLHNYANKLTGNSTVSWVEAYIEYNNIKKNCDGPCTDIIEENGMNEENGNNKNNKNNRTSKILDYVDNDNIEITFTNNKNKKHNTSKYKNKLSFTSK